MKVGIKFGGKIKRLALYIKHIKRKWKTALLGITLFMAMIHYLEGNFGIDQAQPLFFITFSIHGEDIEKVNTTFWKLYTNYGSKTYIVQPVLPVERDGKEKSVVYKYEAPPEYNIIYDKSVDALNRHDSQNEPWYNLREFVGKPTGRCRKLYRSGGNLLCRNFKQNWPIMDGHKFICMDESLQLLTGSRKTDECLVLSFGVSLDISFDIALRDANCEILMFDVDQYDHPLAEDDDYVHFYQVGLSHERIDEFNKEKNRHIKLNTFNNLALDYNFANRLVNILKIDIEGDEWEVLKDISTKPYLDLIGQIVVEIHSIKLKTMNATAQKDWVESAKKIFWAFQDRGFMTISYFDNRVPKMLMPQEENAISYEAGELLLVNSKWYNNSFRREASQKGYNFKLR